MSSVTISEFRALTIWMWREYGIEITKVPAYIIVRDERNEQVQQ